MPSDQPSKAVFLFSLRCLRAELEGRSRPPPPIRGWEIESPIRKQVKRKPSGFMSAVEFQEEVRQLTHF